MGMAASQARQLALTARMNNIEYQGQQINQERTILSQQVNTLYNSLLTIDVPTPPSTSEFTTVRYSGAEGASTFTLGNIIPKGTTYSVDLNYVKTGHYMEKAGTASAQATPSKLLLKETDKKTGISGYDISNLSPIGSTTAEAGHSIMKYQQKGGPNFSGNSDIYYVKKGTNYFEQITKEQAKSPAYNNHDIYELITYSGEELDPQKDYDLTGESPVTLGGYTASELKGIGYIIDNNGKAYHISDSTIETYFENTSTADHTYLLKPEFGAYKIAAPDAEGTEYDNGDKADPNLIGVVAGQPCYTLTGACMDNHSFDEDTYNDYIKAIQDAIPAFADKSAAEIGVAFGVYFTTDPDTRRQIAHFVQVQDIQSAFITQNDNYYVNTYDYIANGQYTEVENKPGCLLTFDSSGRISEIKIPTDYDVEGKPTSYKTVKLEAETVTDDAAYQDAYAKYEYAQYEYDKKQQEINAKTEVIQREDKNLELKLTRLDNERNALKTEMDAVKQVIKDDIDSSFKTFSG